MSSASAGHTPSPVPTARTEDLQMLTSDPARAAGTPRPPAPRAPLGEDVHDPHGPHAAPAPHSVHMDALTLRELRELRRTSQQEEADLSYVRRLLHGRIDILRAELARREAPLSPVLDRLPEILTDAPTTRHSSARHVTLGTPLREEYRELAERMLGEVELSDLTARTAEELQRALGELLRHEFGVSRLRQQLQLTADACSGEIARRYREGEAQVDDLLR
ncbi:ABC transporter substrate-binding protein [Streptomyces polyrhachis]|uniref:ABC transporter substrate-binding protein n=1 Tax=Streptomyces polyrhachis TaxID=1282885 RepID=A0ABW2GKM5_9ACTN